MQKNQRNNDNDCTKWLDRVSKIPKIVLNPLKCNESRKKTTNILSNEWNLKNHPSK